MSIEEITCIRKSTGECRGPEILGRTPAYPGTRDPSFRFG
jgi:hypothetical protein